MSFQEYIYNKSPYILQKKMFDYHCKNLYHKRYGTRFNKALDDLVKMEKLSYSDLVEYQDIKVKELIHHSYNTVEYYNEIMKQRKLVPSDITSACDLQKLPLLTRDIVKNNLDKLISSKHNKKNLMHGHTSGTTGSPLNFYWDNDMWFYNNVFDWRQKLWGGMTPGDPVCVLLGRTIVPPNKKSPPFWQYNAHEKQLWVSSFHLSDEFAPVIFDQIEKFKPKFIEGYPSTLSVFAELAKKHNVKFNLQASFTSSEPLLDTQKEVMTDIFSCNNFDYYGLAERVIWGTECDAHIGKHLSMEYGVTEVVNSHGENIGCNNIGFLVGTSLLNYGMPFIRYKTSDLSSISDTKCACGRASPLMDAVLTKEEDLIHTPDGKTISSSILTHPFKPLKNIEKSQIIQEKIDLLTIKLVKRPGYSDLDTKKLLKAFSDRVGPEVLLNVEFVEDIPREKSGKYKWIISKIDRNGN
jgi:phenylacetate-CoA ligase